LTDAAGQHPGRRSHVVQNPAACDDAVGTVDQLLVAQRVDVDLYGHSATASESGRVYLARRRRASNAPCRSAVRCSGSPLSANVKLIHMSWSGQGGFERRGYHHGNLREALLDAALTLIAEKGPAGFTIAEAARLAGVSPGAPYRHFRDAEALLAEVA